MKWLAASCALCAGCDLLFAIPGLEGPAPEAGVGPIDAASSVACSSIAMLADDFDDGDFDVLWGASVDPGDALVERDGTAQLQLAIPESSVTLFSKAYYAMSEGSLTLDVQAPDFAKGDTFALTLRSEQPGYSVQWYRDTSDTNVESMSVAVIDNGISVPAGSFAFDRIADRYLRTRVSGDRVYFETSPDDTAGSYVTQASAVASSLTVAQVNVRVFRNASAAPFTVLVDHVNGGAPHGTACDVAQLHDTFDSVELLPQWARSEAVGGTSRNVMGQLEMTTAPPAPGSMPDERVTLQPSASYDLRNGSVTIDVEQMVTTTEASGKVRSVALAVQTALGDRIEIQQHDDMLVGLATPKGGSATTQFSLAWNPTSLKWWRISITTDASGVSTATYATSADGDAWLELGSTPNLGGFDRSDLALQTHVVSPTGETARFDNFNVTPP
jgi:hypothetical protein